NVCSDTRQHYNYGHEQLQEAGKKNTGTGCFQISTQRTLCNILVTSPIVQVYNPLTRKVHCQTGQYHILLYIQILWHVQCAGGYLRFIQNQLETLRRFIEQGLKSCNSTSGSCSVTPLVYNLQSHIHRCKSTNNQHCHLYHIGITNYLHTTQTNQQCHYQQDYHDCMQITSPK